MTLYKFMTNSSSYEIVDTILLEIMAGEDNNTLIVSNILDTVKEYNTSLPFTVSVAKTIVPYLKDEQMAVVIREKVDLSANGKNYTIIKNADKDIGKEDFKDVVPNNPSDLPKGFLELRGRSE